VSWPILLVEDDAELCAALVDILSAQGFVVRTAANGEEALRRAREVRPTLIVLDLMMPVMDGKKFLEHRASDPVLAGVPVVVLTAQTEKAAAVAEEVLAVLAKPVHLGRLFTLIRQACDRPIGRSP
jgi:CheY-like chemotaxis protein